MDNFIRPARCLCKALMALVLFSSTAQSADDAGTPREQVIELGELVLTSQVWGQAGDELVVALPGSGAANTRYRELGPLIAEAGYFFVALNQRGIQGSTGNLENLTLHDFADDVVRVIDYYQAPKAHLIGWAMGNRIQRMVATDHPRRVASVTLLAAGGLVAPTAEPGALNRLLSEAGIAVAEKVSLARESLFSPATDDSLVNRYVEQLTYWPQARQAQRAANQAVARDEWWAGVPVLC